MFSDSDGMFNNEMHWNGMNRRRHFNDESGASNSIASLLLLAASCAEGLDCKVNKLVVLRYLFTDNTH